MLRISIGSNSRNTCPNPIDSRKALSGAGRDRQLEAFSVFAAEVLVGRRVIELLGFCVETQLLSRTPGYVAGVTHDGADVPGIDILVKRFSSVAAYRVEEVTDVGLLDPAQVATALPEELIGTVVGFP